MNVPNPWTMTMIQKLALAALIAASLALTACAKKESAPATAN